MKVQEEEFGRKEIRQIFNHIINVYKCLPEHVPTLSNTHTLYLRYTHTHARALSLSNNGSSEQRLK